MLDDPRGDIVVRNDEWGGPTKTKIDDFERHRRAGVEDGRDRVLQEVAIARDSLRQRFREESSAKQESRGGYCGWRSRAPSSWTLAIEDPQEDHGRDGEKKWCVCVCGVWLQLERARRNIKTGKQPRLKLDFEKTKNKDNDLKACSRG